MKKKNLKSLVLNKKAVSSLKFLEEIKGKGASNPYTAPTHIHCCNYW